MSGWRVPDAQSPHAERNSERGGLAIGLPLCFHSSGTAMLEPMRFVAMRAALFDDGRDPVAHQANLAAIYDRALGRCVCAFAVTGGKHILMTGSTTQGEL